MSNQHQILAGIKFELESEEMINDDVQIHVISLTDSENPVHKNLLRVVRNLNIDKTEVYFIKNGDELKLLF